ncbi:MAG TPA: hypothetical protein VHI13_18710 [Candidatus Kapabacteria bacterium]|nr:hypothetical protein [Candidatus Kapabacteria bacterium]
MNSPAADMPGAGCHSAGGGAPFQACMLPGLRLEAAIMVRAIWHQRRRLLPEAAWYLLQTCASRCVCVAMRVRRDAGPSPAWPDVLPIPAISQTQSTTYRGN